MTCAEVGLYLRDRQLNFTDEDRDSLFNLTGGHGFAVAVWCDLALEDGDMRYREVWDRARRGKSGANLAILIESIEAAVDQILMDVLGFRTPLLALLTVAEAVTSDLIGMLEGSSGQRMAHRQAQVIYQELAKRNFVTQVDGSSHNGST